MIRTQSSTDEKWIHSFAVTDVCLHPKKFTVYKITSVVFPINIPEALTCLTVWKRFNDIKALLKFIKKRHKSERLLGIVPTLNNHTFFKRFEADVITERKLFIIRLLDFIGQHPQLYKSQVFQDFFITSQTMPMEENLQFDTDDILCEDTVDAVPNQLTVSDDLVDDNTPIPSTSSSLNDSIDDSTMSSTIVDSTDELNSDGGYSASIENEAIDRDGHNRKTKAMDNLSGEYSFQNPIETPCQPNQRKDLSKFKVLKFIENVMQVQDVATKHVYILKSIDNVYNEPEEFYLPTNFPFMVSLVAYYLTENNVFLLLEQATGGRLYDYIRSYNRHSSNVNRPPIKFPSNKLDKIIKTGNLLKSRPIGIPESRTKPIDQTDENDDDNFSFYDLLQSYYEDVPAADNAKGKNVTENALDQQNDVEAAPHFNLIANDLDVNNILNCSQKLLKSVSSTLKRVQNAIDDDDETPTLTNADILTKLSNSIESLDDGNESDGNVTPPIYGEPYNIQDAIKTENQCKEFDYLDVNQLPRAIIRRWFREIIFAVKHLHANEILCYDLQPDNLLLGKSGEILLTYFYRREFRPNVFDETMHHTCYPIPYIAPDRPLTIQSDVWSIGVIFFELLTGYSFQSCHPNGIMSYYDIQYPENVELDTDSRDLVEGMLQIDPRQRTKLDEIEEHPFFTNI